MCVGSTRFEAGRFDRGTQRLAENQVLVRVLGVWLARHRAGLNPHQCSFLSRGGVCRFSDPVERELKELGNVVSWLLGIRVLTFITVVRRCTGGTCELR